MDMYLLLLVGQAPADPFDDLDEPNDGEDDQDNHKQHSQEPREDVAVRYPNDSFIFD